MVGQQQNKSVISVGNNYPGDRQTKRSGDNSDGTALPWQEDRPIIFFDGDCVMCNGFVDLLLQIDTKELFYISPLQGETARQYLPPLPHNREEWSIYYLDPASSSPAPSSARSSDSSPYQLYAQSDAVIQIWRRLGGLWSVAALGGGIPPFIRDAVYRMVARNRYRLFGRRETCRMPSEAERSRFLP